MLQLSKGAFISFVAYLIPYTTAKQFQLRSLIHRKGRSLKFRTKLSYKKKVGASMVIGEPRLNLKANR